jgi:hypothetical protein
MHAVRRGDKYRRDEVHMNRADERTLTCVTVPPTMPVLEANRELRSAAQLMLDREFGALPITETDLLRAFVHTV